MVTSLLWPMSFGPLVTVLMGFHCMMFFTLECIGFNNILAHTWALFIPHLSAVSNLSNHISFWYHGWAASRQSLLAPPPIFLPHALLSLYLFCPAPLGSLFAGLFFFFFFKQLVTVLSVSYMHFRGIRVKTERADYYCTYMYCILISETVVICCSMNYYLLYHSSFIHINFLPLGLWFSIRSGIFLFCCLNDLGLFPDNNSISVINFIILPLKVERLEVLCGTTRMSQWF